VSPGRLIRLLTGPRVELCVVGDDDQAIYQWRGSDLRNIVEFTGRYHGVRTFTITEPLGKTRQRAPHGRLSDTGRLDGSAVRAAKSGDWRAAGAHKPLRWQG
jgi:UvrD/REP helicase N-terminal domain